MELYCLCIDKDSVGIKKVNGMENSLIVIVIQIVIVFGIIGIVTFFIRLSDTIRMEKRISKYTIKGNNMDDLSYYDRVKYRYKTFVKKQSLRVNKVPLYFQ